MPPNVDKTFRTAIGRAPDPGSSALAEYIFASKYARVVDGKRETWDQACSRIERMHRDFYGERLRPIEAYASAAFSALREKRALGSQRNMQYGGEAVLRKHARAYNCATTYIDRPEAFSQVFWLLLCGCGVGFSVQKHHVAKLPALRRPGQALRHTVVDSIEGWADALQSLMRSYFEGDYTMVFDYSRVRPEGSDLSSGAGKAPGHGPLREALEACRGVLERSVDRGNLRPIDAYDLLMHAACGVLSGGVRRSATLALFSVDDQDMLTAKSGSWTRDNPQRKCSNNSAALLRDTPLDVFERFIDTARESGGEPGVIWLDSTEHVFNPCVESAQVPRTRDGRSGVQFCNLSTVNGAAVRNAHDFFSACAAAAVLGTLQAGYTDFPYLGAASEEITRHEALIGVSITGIQDSPSILLDESVLREGAGIIKNVNALVAEVLGIRAAARCTLLKPEGSTSGLVGSASGKHRWHSKRGIRRVQANRLEECAQVFASVNPSAVEPSVWREGDIVLKFPYEAPDGARLRANETALDQLKDVVLLQRAWIEPGHRSGPSNSVSNTVSVRENEWDQVKVYIHENRTAFAGVSLLPASGDLDYRQAPFVSVDEPERVEELAEWERLRASMAQADYSGARVETDHALEPACAGGACEIL